MLAQVEKKFRGYHDTSFGLEVNKTLIDLANHIVDICPKEKKIFPAMDIRQACLEGKKFLTSHFTLHNIKYCSEKDLESFCFEEHTEEEIRNYFQNMPKISPFKLPIIPCGDALDSQVLENVFFVGDCELLNQLEIIFSGIILEKKTTLFTPHNYVHEIVHTQLDSGKGAVRYSYNQDVLSVFLGLVSIFDKQDTNLLQDAMQEYYRRISLYIVGLCDYLENESSVLSASDYEEYSKYIISTLKGLRMFREYQKNPKLRKYILQCVQNVFNHRVPLEDVLNFCDISAQEEIDYIMKL